MRPLAELPREGIRALLFDIDETLTTEGKLTAAAYAAMEQLKAAGRLVVPVTGRAAGWCDHIARMWPVDAVIGENGAFYFWFGDGKLQRRYFDTLKERSSKQRRLEGIARSILAAVPGAALASDQHYRETDLAIDFCEDVPALPLSSAENIAAQMRAAGLTARISSIHVNGWFGNYDKLTMARTLLVERFGLDLAKENRSVVFAGDSPNDAPMFGFFEHSVGVANVRRFEALLPEKPKFVTPSASGAGFAEIVAHLLGR